MFGKLIDYWRTRKQLAEIRENPVYVDTLAFLQSALSDPNSPLFQMSDENKIRLHNEILCDVLEKFAQDDPVQAVRNALASHVFGVAEVSVLLTTPETSMYEGISGELRPMVQELARVNAGLKELFYGLGETPATNQEMLDVLYVHHHLRSLWMKTYNFHRMRLGDHHQDGAKDWFLPYLMSQCIYLEYSFRSDLGLPSNIQADEQDGLLSPGFARWAAYGTWPEIVEAGHKFPRLMWEEQWESTFRETSPFTDVDMNLLTH